MNEYPNADLALVRRLERAEATANAAFVEARAVVAPKVGAAWIDVAGVYAMFDGVGSPITQTFGLGLFADCLEPEFDRLEAFFDAFGSATVHEVSSFAPDATTALLRSRGYAPIEESVVLVRPTAVDVAPSTSLVTVRHLGIGDRASWAQLSADGWRSEGEGVADFLNAFGLIMTRARGIECFVAEVNGEPIATAAMSLATNVALLAGASTIPTGRRQGAQRALLDARLTYAAAAPIDLAMIVTHPSSGSQRNAERRGFRPVYTRTKWERPHAR